MVTVVVTVVTGSGDNGYSHDSGDVAPMVTMCGAVVSSDSADD
jgi:hypothetical protein